MEDDRFGGLNSIFIFSVNDWNLIFQLDSVIGNLARELSISYSSDFRYITASRSKDDICICRVWERNTEGEISQISYLGEKGELGLPKGKIRAVSPNGQYLILDRYPSSGTIFLVETTTAQTIKTLSGNITFTSFSPDGEFLIVVHPDAQITIWKIPSGDIISQVFHYDEALGVGALGIFNDGVRPVNVTFSPDTKYLVVSIKYTKTGLPHTLTKIYETTTGREVCHIPGDASIIAYSPDGHYLATAFSLVQVDVSVWHSWWQEDLMTAVCKYLLPRNLTREEWIQFLGDEPYQRTCPNLTHDLVQMDAPDVLEKGKKLVKEGNVKEAIDAYNEAQTLDPEFHPSGSDWNTLCWFGTLHGYASDVMYACDMALTFNYVSKTLASYRDSRGVARALVDNFQGAIEDFQFYITHAEATDAGKAQRQQWINSLCNGENPFTPDEISRLFNE